MNELNEKINVEEFKKGRELNPKDILGYLQAHKMKFWSWGANGFMNIFNYGFRFKTNGHHHKGHVYIRVNGSDLFDVYLTTVQGKILHIMNDVFIDELFNRLDEKIEKIPAYKD